jgi:hypothetical protein
LSSYLILKGLGGSVNSRISLNSKTIIISVLNLEILSHGFFAV